MLAVQRQQRRSISLQLSPHLYVSLSHSFPVSQFNVLRLWTQRTLLLTLTACAVVYTKHIIQQGETLVRGVREHVAATAKPFPDIFWACPSGNTSAIQGIRTYEYKAKEAFSVIDLGKWGAVCANSVAYVTDAVQHVYESEAAAKRNVKYIAGASNEREESNNCWRYPAYASRGELQASFGRWGMDLSTCCSQSSVSNIFQSKPC